MCSQPVENLPLHISAILTNRTLWFCSSAWYNNNQHHSWPTAKPYCIVSLSLNFHYTSTFTFINSICRLLFKLPRIVPDQREKFDCEDIFKKHSREAEVNDENDEGNQKKNISISWRSGWDRTTRISFLNFWIWINMACWEYWIFALKSRQNLILNNNSIQVIISKYSGESGGKRGRGKEKRHFQIKNSSLFQKAGAPLQTLVQESLSLFL